MGGKGEIIFRDSAWHLKMRRKKKANGVKLSDFDEARGGKRDRSGVRV